MPNIIELNLLENKSIVAQMQGYPLLNENSYKIVAGEENSTIFSIVSIPQQYNTARLTVEMVNSQGFGIEESDIENKEFTLPNGMAVAGYGYILIRAYIEEEVAVFQPLKIKVWNTLPNWQNYIRKDRLEKQISLIIKPNDWVDNQTTQTLSGANAQKTIVASADYRYLKEFADAEIEAVSMGINSVTFKCRQTPSSNIIVNVSVYNESTPTEQITIKASDWQNNLCTKIIEGLKLSNTIMVSAEPSIQGNTAKFVQSLIQISSTGIDTITFSCVETPTEDIVVVVSLIS